jgi:uncharacterized protein (TIGR02145 family)
LEEYLKANRYNYDSTIAENKIAKSLAAKTEWKTSTDIGAIGNDLTKNNRCRFSALPGGFRFHYGVFESIGAHGNWWSFKTIDTHHAFHSNLEYPKVSFNHIRGNKKMGFSVRCVMD